MPLGTSSGRPTRTRGMSALALDLGAQWILVDAGEGTQHQLLRFGLPTSRLAAVLITHLHGDHVLGLPGLLSTLALNGRDEPLTVIGPDGLGRLLSGFEEAGVLNLPFPLELTELVDDRGDGASTELRPCPTVAGHRIVAVALRHRVPCHGFRVTAPERRGRFDAVAAERLGLPHGPERGRLAAGFEVTVGGRVIAPGDVVAPSRPGVSVAVFGDTTPCSAARALAHGCALVVHEATYADGMEAEAEMWRHSTARQTATVARDADVDRLVLTHFSSRYPVIDQLVYEAREVFPASHAAVEGAWIEAEG